MASLDELRHEAAAATAAFKMKIHAAFAFVGGGVMNFSDVLSDAANKLLSFLPNVQAFIKAEYVQYIGLGITGAMGASAFVQAYKMKASKKAALASAEAQAIADEAAKADVGSAPAPVEVPVAVAPAAAEVAEAPIVEAPKDSANG